MIIDGSAIFAIILIPFLFVFSDAQPEKHAGPRIFEQKQFTVVGIQVRTNNSREATGHGEIPKQWDRLFKEGILSKIPKKSDENIVVVYSNYQSDYKGDYDYLIGAKVDQATNLPGGMVAKTVAGGKYAVLTTEAGQVGKVVSGEWQKIWKLEDNSKLGGVRAYKTDFEIYDQRSRDPQDSQVDIYVGLR